MRLGQECVDLVASRVVTNGVGAFFRLHSLQALHRISIEEIDCAGISTSHVEMFPIRVVEYHIRRSRQIKWTRRLPRVQVDCEQDSLITSAEEPSSLEINVEPMRTCRQNIVCVNDAIGVQADDRDYLRWFGNVDVETLRLLVEDCPSRSSRHENIGSKNIFLHVNNGRSDWNRIVWS